MSNFEMIQNFEIRIEYLMITGQNLEIENQITGKKSKFYGKNKNYQVELNF